MRLSYRKRIFILFFFIFSYQYSFAQDKKSFGASISILKANGQPAEGILYDGETVKGIISFNEKEWDGKSRFYCYIFHYTDGENKLNLAFPLFESVDNNFPLKNADGSFKKTFTLFEGIVGEPYGRDNFILVMTEHPIPNYMSLADNGTRGSHSNKEELMKLVKGSKLSEIYSPAFGDFSVKTLQFESRPATEKSGLVKTSPVPSGAGAQKRSVFVLNDSAEIFITPKPQDDIVRDSFPIIEITDPFFDTTTTRGAKILSTAPSKKILIRGITVDRRSGIKSVTVNGNPVTTYKESVGYFDYQYELIDGTNTADVTVENNNGFKKLVRLRFQYNAPKQEVTTIGKDLLLVIGINTYIGWPPLNNALKDAKDFESLMIQQYGFIKSNVIELFDKKATNKNIYSTLDSLLHALNPNDRLLVYYSGHGFYDKTQDLGYWIPADAHGNNEYLDNLRITRMFARMKAKNIFVIADACYSGQLLRDMQRENLNTDKSRMVLCSGKLQPVSDGEAGTNSPFAKEVLDYLRTTTTSRVLASDLITDVKNKFKNKDGQKAVGGAIDEVGDENGDFVFERKH